MLFTNIEALVPGHEVQCYLLVPLGEEPRGRDAIWKEEEDNNGEDACWQALNDEQDLPGLDRAVNLSDGVC